MKFARVVLVILLPVFAPQIASAQDKSEILITTRPSGATIYLKGEFDLVANTPAKLPMDISGKYDAKITRPGYETWRGELNFVPGSDNEINIDLSRKTRVKAALRSIIIPGWGQRYSGNSTKGTLLTSAALLSGAAVVITDRIYQNKKRDYNTALADFNSAGSIDEKNRLKIVLDDSQRKAYDAESDRNLAIAFGIGAWAFNLVDALIFFPSGEVFYPTVSSLGDGASVQLTARF